MRTIVDEGHENSKAIRVFQQVLTALHKHTNPLFVKHLPNFSADMRAIQRLIGRPAPTPTGPRSK